MKVISLVPLVVLAFSATGIAAERCTSEEIEADRLWPTKQCGLNGSRVTSPLPVRQTANSRVPTKAEVGTKTWLLTIERNERSVTRALKVGNRSEMERQSIDVRRRISEISKWPKDDEWTYARVYCATRAQELANFVSDKLKASAQSEIAAEDSFKAYVTAGKECLKGLSELK